MNLPRRVISRLRSVINYVTVCLMNCGPTRNWGEGMDDMEPAYECPQCHETSGASAFDGNDGFCSKGCRQDALEELYGCNDWEPRKVEA